MNKEMNKKFWRGKKVYVTGATGFKGSWLFISLLEAGASVRGMGLAPENTDWIFNFLPQHVRGLISIFDIRDTQKLSHELSSFQPEIVFHMAAQPLVRLSYDIPVETFDVNVMGTVRFLEEVRKIESVKSITVITSDKCYLNLESGKPFRESDPLGGHDPYSASKACQDIAAQAYYKSFFQPKKIALATVRSGNVIGGGDWASDRIIPDYFRAKRSTQKLVTRNLSATRPWQHVLEPIRGYLAVAEKSYKRPAEFSGAYNFGPAKANSVPVKELLQRIDKSLEGSGEDKVPYILAKGAKPVKESKLLSLDSSFARKKIGWSPKLNLTESVRLTTEWYCQYLKGAEPFELCRQQIQNYNQA